MALDRKTRILHIITRLEHGGAPIALLQQLERLSADRFHCTLATGLTPEPARDTVFDEQGLLERLDWDRDLARTVITGFLGDIPGQILKLKELLERGDAAEVRRQAHTIKGAAGNGSGDGLLAMALEMEKAGKAGKLDHAAGILPRLEVAFDKLRTTLEQDGWA